MRSSTEHLDTLAPEHPPWTLSRPALDNIRAMTSPVPTQTLPTPALRSSVGSRTSSIRRDATAEHALGAYHLARRTLALLAERGELERVEESETAIITAAALLHDIGHYPFSHALEEIGALDHEEVAHELIFRGPVAEVLTDALGKDVPTRIHALIRGQSTSPLQGLISGSLDLDKIEYLKRDALMCGVPYGEIDSIACSTPPPYR